MGIFEWLLARFLGIGMLGVLVIVLRETAEKWRKGGWREALATSWGDADIWEALGTVFVFLLMLVIGLTLLLWKL